MKRTDLGEVLNFVEEMSEDKHICLVYGTAAELVEILVPYFGKGLENNEVCIWVLSAPVHMDDAKKALKNRIPDLDIYIEKEQMILLYTWDLYTNSGVFDPVKAVQFWEEKEAQVLKKGFKSLRISGSGNWARGEQWSEIGKYEEAVNDLIQEKQIKAICTYSNEIVDLPKILSVGIHHSKVIIYQEDKWQIIDATNTKTLLEKLEKPYHAD